LTFTVAAGAPTGSYPVTITGTSGSLTRTTTVTLNVTAAPTASITLTGSPTSVTLARGGGATVGIKITRGGGVTGTAALAAISLPSKASVSFSPA